MLALTATNHTIEMVTSSNADIEWAVTYALLTPTSQTLDLVSDQGVLAAAQDTTIIPAPSSGLRHQVKWISVRNVDPTDAVTITIQKDVAGTEYRASPSMVLQPGEEACYVDQLGWVVYDTEARPQVDDTALSGGPNINRIPFWASANGTSNRTWTSGQTVAAYIGRAMNRIPAGSAYTGCYQIATSPATVTWHEVAIATGLHPGPGNNPTLTVQGFADVSGDTGTGVKRRPITIAANREIPRGADLWLLVGSQATTPGAVRASSFGDQVELGLSAIATARPSLIVGTPTAFTVDTSANNVPLFGGFSSLS